MAASHKRRGAAILVVTGDKELDRKLRNLGNAGVKISAAAIRKGLKIVEKSIKAEVPSEARSIRRGIGSRFIRRPKGKQQVSAKAGVHVGRAAKHARHAHLYAMGTKDRWTKKGASRGRMQPTPIVSRGYQKAERNAISVIVQTVREGIAKEARR